jgi:integrase
MSKLPLRYVQAWVDEDGRAHHYFRRRGFRRRPLPGMPGTAEFNRAYEAAMAEKPEPIGAALRSKPGSVSAAIAAYLDSQLYFGSRAKDTQDMQRSVLNRFRDQYGQERLAGMPPKFIAAILSSKQPHAARSWLKALRAFSRFAVEQGFLNADPTQGIKLPTIKTAGHATWTNAEITQYEAAHPIGSRARLALALGLYTMQRRGDVLHMGRQHVRDGVLQVKQRKTGTVLAIPVRPELQAILDATPTGHLTFLVNEQGRPYPRTGFSRQFRAWCAEAKLPDHCVFHGLRKAGCRILAEAGCSVHEIAAWSGHASLHEIKRYTDAVDQQRLAQMALAKTKAATSSVKPHETEVSKPLKRLKKNA